MQDDDIIKNLLKPRRNFIKEFFTPKQTIEKYRLGILKNKYLLIDLLCKVIFWRKDQLLFARPRQEKLFKRVILRPHTSDIEVFKQVLIDEEYQKSIKYLFSFVNPQEVFHVIDAGSNIGLSTVYFSHYLPFAHIIAIEPDDENVKFLIQNLKLNKIEKNCTIIKAALWVTDDEHLFLSNNFRDGESWSKSVVNQSEKASAGNWVKTITLKSVLKICGENSIIDLFKIDIEGAEKALFENRLFLDLLRTQVKFVSIEIHEEIMAKEYYLTQMQAINFSMLYNSHTIIFKNDSLLLN